MLWSQGTLRESDETLVAKPSFCVPFTFESEKQTFSVCGLLFVTGLLSSPFRRLSFGSPVRTGRVLVAAAAVGLAGDIGGLVTFQP